MFSKSTFDFLRELSANNNRNWFEANKARYEAVIREPALDFIEAMAPVLEKFAPSFRAEARKMGGSLMRIYRDARFSRDKTPYKTNIGIQFRHTLGKDVHAPGFYLHIAADECFFGAGSWHPESAALGKYRDHIASHPEQWFSICKDKTFRAQWELWGESLTRPPRGYDAYHPAIEEIKRKDFLCLSPVTAGQVTETGLVKLAGRRFAETGPFMKFLCEAQGLAY
ncbi:MAG: DUF2461 domain-containing protein [Gallionella sp.]